MILLFSVDGISSSYIAFLGITIVFSGLFFLMLAMYGFIYVVRGYKDKKEREKLVSQDKQLKTSLNSEIVAAISLAIALEKEKISKEKEYILTWRKYHKTLSPWVLDGRISALYNFSKVRRKM